MTGLLDAGQDRTHRILTEVNALASRFPYNHKGGGAAHAACRRQLPFTMKFAKHVRPLSLYGRGLG